MNHEPQTSFPRKTVLIAGVGRSGTSWLGKILDSSPHVFYKPQPDDVSRYPWFRGIPSRLDPTPEFDRFREPFARALQRTFWSHSANLLTRPDFHKDFLHNGAWRCLNTGLRAWRKATRGGGPIVRIPRWMFRGDTGNVTFVLKSVVSNMRLTWIHRHFPQIKIILIIRHPGGYLNSVFRGARCHGWGNIGKRARLDESVLPFRLPEHRKYADIVENGSDFERELIYWIVTNETPILELGDSPVLKVVAYEDMCRRPQAVVEEILSFLQISHSQRTARFLAETTAEDHAAYYSIYKNPLRSAYNWRAELNREHIAVIGRFMQHCLLNSLWP